MENSVRKYRFAIVKFTEEDDALGVIPLCWIQENGERCSYPFAPTEAKRHKLLREEALPTSSWTSHKISIMKIYGTYSEARENLRRAEETSNLESDEEVLVKREIVLPGEVSSEDEGPRDKHSRLASRVLHPYPPLDSFHNQNTFSPGSTSSASLSYTSSQQPSSLILQPLQLNLNQPEQQQSIFTSPMNSIASSNPANPCISSPLGSGRTWLNSPGNKGIRETPPMDIDRLWSILTQLQTTSASQSEEISQLNKKIDILLAQCSATTCKIESNDSMMLNALPLSTMEEFNEFEEKLNSQEFRSLVVKLLATIGGKESKLLIFNCMKRCLTSHLGMRFSYTGKPAKDQNKKKKSPFVSTSLCSVIQSAVRKIYPGTTEEHLKIHMGHWLQQSKNRLQSSRVVRAKTNSREAANNVE